MKTKSDSIALINELPPNKFWDDWRTKTGEMPPDFDKLPDIPNMPDSFAFNKGRNPSIKAWMKYRSELLEKFKTYLLGTYPLPVKNIQAKSIDIVKLPEGGEQWDVELVFGPKRKARMRFQILIPPLKGRKLPVFITQRNHEAWTRQALLRDYIAVAYNGCDAIDDTQAYREIWPNHDWTRLCRRAWGASRVLDWLHTLPFINKNHTCLAGHSRNGKLALWGGAMDPRFNVIISSSSGVGGATPFRLCNDACFGEGIEIITSLKHNEEWFHPRIRFFAGREHKIPIDANLLLALNAPNAVLVSVAANDGCENIKAVERSVDAASKVWRIFNKKSNLKILRRWGNHDTSTETIERYLDWCDLHFTGKADKEREINQKFPYSPMFPYSFSKWKQKSEKISIPKPPPAPDFTKINIKTWKSGQAERQKRILSLLGSPSGARALSQPNYSDEEVAYRSSLYQRPQLPDNSSIVKLQFTFGEYISGALYAQKKDLPHDKNISHNDGKTAKKSPVVIWLSPDSPSSGYAGAYLPRDIADKKCPTGGIGGIGGIKMPIPIVNAGFMTLTYDHIGNGGRIDEARLFYDRHPRWSLLGKMVHDTRCAIEAVRQLDFVDKKRIFLVGFGIGGTVALITGALEQSIAGVGCVCGFSPMRPDTSDRPTGGIARYACYPGEGLLPILRLFAGNAKRQADIPIDFDEIMASIAPRKLICVTPTLDRESNHHDICEMMKQVGALYRRMGREEYFKHSSPVEHRRFTPKIQRIVYEALSKYI